ncbi:uroporphyrinogen-III C-methyltransferase [Alcaligenes sp. SMD-FA]|uniref:uroporphyrinogen-III C-methyltransferase n=1 Tax=Alcaligenes sp. SMD-FA TaxID=2991054 RepID=UPI0022274DAC|nr:uroporphyrinogen-III C-methyltransferase [Alcaligenes sp. SMD-FA]UYY85805.1 uroporphyrinogen-III C-methyltransferase [Alcaligenes sp. SMD-FA]
MNDKTENASASEPETPISSPASTPASRPYSDPKESTTTPEQRKSGAGPAYALTAVVVVLAAAGLWYQNSLLEKHKAELQAQLATNINTTEQARQTAQQALALAQRQSDKLAQLEKSFNDSTEQFHDLSQAFQTMTDSGSELVLLNDVDHLATIAQQQLMLGGNVANAIVSLEAAQAQLARANRVGLASLQQTLNGDLERLRAAATVDVASLSRQLDTLSRYVSEAPLLVPDDVAGGANTEALDLSSESVASAELPADAPWWERSWNTVQQWGSSAWRSVSHDLGQFVSIRRVDDAAALLMSPDQAARLRENLRLRIMAAQLAMMMNQSAVWQTELNAVATALEKRFDTQSNQVQQALRLTRQLQDTRIGARLPTVNNTLAAIESLRQAQAGRSQNNTDDTTTEQGDTGPVPSDSSQSTEPAKQEEPAASAAEQAESGAPAQAETEQPAQAQG